MEFQAAIEVATKLQCCLACGSVNVLHRHRNETPGQHNPERTRTNVWANVPLTAFDVRNGHVAYGGGGRLTNHHIFPPDAQHQRHYREAGKMFGVSSSTGRGT